MQCEEAKQLASRQVDGELEQAQAQALAAHLASCEACRAELSRWTRIGEELSSMELSRRHDRGLDAFEAHVYARAERGLAWALLSLAAVLLLGSGAFYLVRDFLLDPAVAWPLRAGVAAGVLGLIVLAVGAVRHRLATHKSDPYRGVQR